MDTNAKHDAHHIQHILESTMSVYGIVKKQVFACFVDNASNMTKTTNLMNKDSQDENSEAAKEYENENEVEELKPESFIPPEVHHLRCTEHMLQLVIRDGLKKPSIASFLTKIRAVAQHLRAPCTDNILKRRAEKELSLI